jgi:hypothetical protein
MSRPVDAVHGSTTAQSVEAKDNWGQKRSALAHAINDLRRATRFGDDDKAADAAARIANLMGVELGDIKDKSADDILQLLGDKLGVQGDVTATTVEKAVMDKTQRQALIQKL